MKKLFFAFAAIVMSAFATEANAQILSQFDWMPPYKLGATVGLNVPSFSGAPYSSSIGFQTGLNLMLDGSDVFRNSFARIELKYSMKGAYHENILKEDTDYIKDWYTTNYLEIPVHVGYAKYINEDWSVMAEAGPYFALGLWGRRKTTRCNDGSTTHTTESYFSDLNCTRFDFGMGLQLSAIYLKDYQIHMAYDFGFINMHSSFQQNRNFSIGLTYFFE